MTARNEGKALTEVVEEVAAIRGAPTNVIAALARVQADIGGIEKRRGNEGGLQYAFRGIDAVSAAAQPLFGKYGIVIVPTVERYVIDEITVNGKPWSDATVEVRWTIYGPGGVDDKIEAVTVGLGRDNSDKPYPKALTQAYKNLLLRVLTIGDPADDADGHTVERDQPARAKTIAESEVDVLIERLKALSDRPDEAESVKMWSQGMDKSLAPRALLQDDEWRVDVTTMLDELDAEQAVAHAFGLAVDDGLPAQPEFDIDPE